ncbi:MAG: hypothetical protein N3G76_00995 [Candidatus Micrarchaeota archaeon]|nr:hypothetical protein [Candidatus Micrarchaeota archaeon]
MSRYFDFHVSFDWKGFSSEGYAKVFYPNIITGGNRYDAARINIAYVSSPEKPLPSRYDLVNFKGFAVNVDQLADVREKRRAVEVCVADVKQAIFSGRMHQARFFCNVLRAYKVPFVMTSGATTIYEVKSPREMAFIGEMLGFTQKQALLSLSDTASIILESKGWL